MTTTPFATDIRLELPLGTNSFQHQLHRDEQIRWEEPDNRFITNVHAATLTLHIPTGRDTKRPVVLIFPGGGYSGVSIDKEGHYVAAWLNERGIAAAVVKYRLPNPGGGSTVPLPWQDALEALKVLRLVGNEFALNLDHLCLLGFSAGGHLAASIALRIDELDPEHLLPRPSHAALIYPVVSIATVTPHTWSFKMLLGDDVTDEVRLSYSLENHVKPSSPPLFLFHARDDSRVPCANSELLHAAARKAGVPSVLQFSESGGHGFGLGRPGTDAAEWPERFANWFREGSGCVTQ